VSSFHQYDRARGFFEMQRTPVRSQTIVALGYDDEEKILEIEFRRRGTYQYLNVPDFLYRGLMLAESKGSFFNTRIANRYEHREVK
jgi:hypothetical protein